MRHVERI